MGEPCKKLLNANNRSSVKAFEDDLQYMPNSTTASSSIRELRPMVR